MLDLKNENADMAATIADLRAWTNENAAAAATISDLRALENENADMAATITDLRAFKNENIEIAATIQATIQATVMDLRDFMRNQDVKLYAPPLEPTKTASDQRFSSSYTERDEEGVPTFSI